MKNSFKIIFSSSKILPFCVLLVFIFLSGTALFSLFERVLELPFFNTHNPNELWNSHKIERISEGLPLYPSLSAHYPNLWDKYVTENNYPPLSFYFTFFLWKIPGLSSLKLITLGRVMSVFSVLSISLIIGMFSWILSKSVFEDCGQNFTQKFCMRENYGAFFAGTLFFLILNASFFKDYFVLYDPQWVAELISMLGLSVFFVIDSPLGIIFTACLLVTAGFFKHNLITAPLALTFFIFFFRSKKDFILWISVFIFLLIIGFLLCDFFYGKDFFDNIFLYEKNRKHHSIIDAVKGRGVIHLLIFLGIELVFLADFYRKALFKKPEICFWIVFFIIALTSGIYGRTGEFCAMNVFFDAAIGCSVLMGSCLLPLLYMPWPEKDDLFLRLKKIFLQVALLVILGNTFEWILFYF